MVPIPNSWATARNHCSKCFDHLIDGAFTSENIRAAFLIKAAGFELLLLTTRGFLFTAWLFRGIDRHEGTIPI